MEIHDAFMSISFLYGIFDLDYARQASKRASEQASKSESESGEGTCVMMWRAIPVAKEAYGSSVERRFHTHC